MEERYLRVPYHFLGAVVGWLVGVTLLVLATVEDGHEVEFGLWALAVIAAASVWWCHAALMRSQIRLLEAFDLQLRMRDQVQERVNGVPRIPTPR